MSEGWIEQFEDTDTAVLALKERYNTLWRELPDEYWLMRLMQEVGELASALAGDHDDSPDWELTQIAAICLNWLEKGATAANEETP